MNYILQTKKNQKSGFTIIETMISISVFLVVVMIGMGALLNANLLHEKSQKMRSIMDNLNFVMEDMSRNLRTGYDYTCLSRGSDSTEGCWWVGFKHQSGGQWVYFVGNLETSQSDLGAGIFKSTEGSNPDKFTKMTPDEVEVDLNNSGFWISGAESGDNKQPFVTIRLIGEINFREVKTPFSLQTSVSQRNIDI